MVAASTAFYVVFTGAKSSEGFTYAMDAVFCLVLLVFWRKGGRFRRRIKGEQGYRSLSRGERWLLNLGGIFIFVMAVIMIGIMENVQGYEIDSGWRILFLMTGSISIALLAVVMIAFVMQGSRKEYYQRESELRERYLKTELEHFKAYRQAQQVMYLNEFRWEIERTFRDYAWVEYDFLQQKGLLGADDERAVQALDREKSKNVWLQIHRENFARMMHAPVREAREEEMALLVRKIYEINKPQTRRVVLRRE